MALMLNGMRTDFHVTFADDESSVSMADLQRGFNDNYFPLLKGFRLWKGSINNSSTGNGKF